MPYQNSFNRIWEEVLSRLCPYTRELLETCQNFILFDGDRVLVGINSRVLLPLVRLKASEIESVFQLVCQIEIKAVFAFFPVSRTQINSGVPAFSFHKSHVTCDDTSLTYHLGSQAILKAIDNNLNSSTRALLRASQLHFTYNGLIWHVVIAAPSKTILERMLKRTQTIAKTFDRGLTVFFLSLCIEGELVPFYNISGKAERKILVTDCVFLQTRDDRNPNWVHLFSIDAIAKGNG